MRLVGARVSTPDAPPASSRAAAARDWAARRPGYQQAEVAQAAAKREAEKKAKEEAAKAKQDAKKSTR